MCCYNFAALLSSTFLYWPWYTALKMERKTDRSRPGVKMQLKPKNFFIIPCHSWCSPVRKTDTSSNRRNEPYEWNNMEDKANHSIISTFYHHALPINVTHTHCLHQLPTKPTLHKPSKFFSLQFVSLLSVLAARVVFGSLEISRSLAYTM